MQLILDADEVQRALISAADRKLAITFDTTCADVSIAIEGDYVDIDTISATVQIDASEDD